MKADYFKIKLFFAMIIISLFAVISGSYAVQMTDPDDYEYSTGDDDGYIYQYNKQTKVTKRLFKGQYVNPSHKKDRFVYYIDNPKTTTLYVYDIVTANRTLLCTIKKTDIYISSQWSANDKYIYVFRGDEALRKYNDEAELIVFYDSTTAKQLLGTAIPAGAFKAFEWISPDEVLTDVAHYEHPDSHEIIIFDLSTGKKRVLLKTSSMTKYFWMGKYEPNKIYIASSSISPNENITYWIMDNNGNILREATQKEITE